MPIYEYRCDEGHTFEVRQRMADDPVETCVNCERPVQRVFSPVAVHFKGSGFYSTDYGKRKGGESSEGDGGGSDKSEAGGESKKSGDGEGSGSGESKGSPDEGKGSGGKSKGSSDTAAKATAGSSSSADR